MRQNTVRLPAFLPFDLRDASTMKPHDILIAGRWQPSQASGSFRPENPATGKALDDAYPVSSWADVDAALAAAATAAEPLAQAAPELVADFLDGYASAIEGQAAGLVELAHAETALPVKPRLADVELPRTTGQLREAARAARDGSWLMPTIDSRLNIRSCHVPLGPVWVFGPNNFPFAFNSIAGGDFAAAIATRNPVIAKANTSHPGTTRMLAQLAHDAAAAAGLPAGSIQLLYRTSHADGARAVADPRVGATGYTGSRSAGLALKAAADAAGKPIYLELSSINPVLMLPGALRNRVPQFAGEFAASCLMGSGQFCTNPGLVLLLACPETDDFVRAAIAAFQTAPAGTLLSRGVRQSLASGIDRLTSAGAELLTGGRSADAPGYVYQNTLLSISGRQFLSDPGTFQTEAFGNASLLVILADEAEALAALDALEGNLTGCIYSAADGSDDALYARLAFRLQRKVGRILNDKMPTGVAVSSAMNHGGPYPATGHPGFTAVGIPAALRRFTALVCYDNVRAQRLPPALADKNPTGTMWRLIDGQWTQRDVPAAR
jgi:NADP-dependent aldehyde dehydrogenase